MKDIIRFPQFVSFTLTNSCNLRCKMCGQWSEKGYMKEQSSIHRHTLQTEHWIRVIDEITENGVTSILIRGGEPFLYPGIMEIIEYSIGKNMFVSIDTNGTCLKKNQIDKLVDLKNIHLTFSLDGPEPIHDLVRGVNGTYEKLKENIERLLECEKIKNTEISKSVTFTISDLNYIYLGDIPDITRELGIKTICIVPYYYFDEETGKQYEKILKDNFNCKAYSWKGFHHEVSGVEPEKFKIQYHKYLTNLQTINDYHFLPLTQDEYALWFKDCHTQIGSPECSSVEKMIDIQPSGDINFCVDFPDYVFGNIKNQTISEIWNSEAAEKFRIYRRKTPLPICKRCGNKRITVASEAQ